MRAPIRIGLAGLGIHGVRYATHLLRGDVPGAMLAAVSRRDEGAGREFALRHGLLYVRDPCELATLSGIDAVALVLPPHLHAAAALECLEAGRAVLVEKPLASDTPSAAALSARTAATGTLLMVAHTLRFDPVVLAIRREAMELGPLRIVAITQRFEPSPRAWLDEPGQGGCILNTGVHGFDLLRFLTGAEPVTIQAEAGCVVTRRKEDQFVAAIRLEPGAILATIDNARTTLARSGRIEVVGEMGCVRGDHIHRTLFRGEKGGEHDLGRLPAVPTVVEALGAFTRALVDGKPPPITVDDGLAAVAMADAALLSARLGRRVSLDEVRG